MGENTSITAWAEQDLQLHPYSRRGHVGTSCSACKSTRHDETGAMWSFYILKMVDITIERSCESGQCEVRSRAGRTSTVIGQRLAEKLVFGNLSERQDGKAREYDIFSSTCQYGQF
jgi:hypothetical protein